MSIRNELIGREFPIGSAGHVVLMDCMGSDDDIVSAARTSYGKGTMKASKDSTLLRYLMRHGHATPFEMATVKFGVKLPIFVARQWHRHRAFSINEYSMRYSESIDDMATVAPDEWRSQSADNKQGSGVGEIRWPEGIDLELIDDDTPGHFLTHQQELLQRQAKSVYQDRLSAGVAREQARNDLPVSNYTQMVWMGNLRNLLWSFLIQRMDSHSQAEIREFADVIGNEIIAKIFPLTWQAFQDYGLNAIKLSALDIRAIPAYISDSTIGVANLIPNERERIEFYAKMKRIGI